MRLTVLGCSGTFPAAHSGCSSYLLSHDGFTVLVDAGTGAVSALQRHGGLERVDAVFLSHLHADHCLDLVPFTYARRYGPGGSLPPLAVYGPTGTAGRITAAGGWPSADGLEAVWDFHEVAEGHLAIGPFEVELAAVNHPVLCHASRWTAGGRSLAYSGDTGESDDLVRVSKGVDVALFEASWYDGDDTPPGVHLTGVQAGAHAARAGAERLLLTHVTPWGSRERTLDEASRTFPGPHEVVEAGATYDV